MKVVTVCCAALWVLWGVSPRIDSLVQGHPELRRGAMWAIVFLGAVTLVAAVVCGVMFVRARRQQKMENGTSKEAAEEVWISAEAAMKPALGLAFVGVFFAVLFWLGMLFVNPVDKLIAYRIVLGAAGVMTMVMVVCGIKWIAGLTQGQPELEARG